jgi:hypothetical protein
MTNPIRRILSDFPRAATPHERALYVARLFGFVLGVIMVATVIGVLLWTAMEHL